MPETLGSHPEELSKEEQRKRSAGLIRGFLSQKSPEERSSIESKLLEYVNAEVMAESSKDAYLDLHNRQKSQLAETYDDAKISDEHKQAIKGAAYTAKNESPEAKDSLNWLQEKARLSQELASEAAQQGWQVSELRDKYEAEARAWADQQEHTETDQAA